MQRDDRGDFVAGHDHRDVDLLVSAHGIDAALQGLIEDALVEEHQGIHRHVLGGGSDVAMHRQVGEKCLDLGFGGEEVFAGPHAVETDEAYDPLHIGALGVYGVVMETEHLADVIEEFWMLTLVASDIQGFRHGALLLIIDTIKVYSISWPDDRSSKDGGAYAQLAHV